MDSDNQGESSGGPSGQPIKRKRGRPPKDPNLRPAEAARVHPDSGGKNEHIAEKSNRSVGPECMIGQAVTGVVDAIYCDGYILTVRIGNSNTNLNGVAFKPGHCAPITAENDIAPHIPMIARNFVNFTTVDLGGSRGKGPAMQTDSMRPSKRKGAPLNASSSVPPVCPRGSAVPFAHQSVLPSRLPTSPILGDEEVYTVEPLSMIPPPDHSIDDGPTIAALKFHPNCQFAPGSGEQDQDDDSSMNDDCTLEGKLKPVTPSEIDTRGASQTSDGKIQDGKEALKSSSDDSDICSGQDTGNSNEHFSTESLQDASAVKPLFNFGTGKMADLLQKNAKENEVQTADQQSSATGVKCQERMTEIDQEDEAPSSDHNA